MANPWSEESKAIDKQMLREAIRSLPDAQYDAILYCEILGFTPPEVASVLGLSRQLVARNLKAAKASLQKILLE